MIDGISGNQMPMLHQQGRGANALTNTQQQLVSKTLSRYDANNLSETDAKAIVSAFSEAEIQPGKALAEAMAAQGFDAAVVGQAAGAKPPPPPPSQDNGSGINIDQKSLQSLLSLLDQTQRSDISEEERTSILQTIRETLVPEEGIVDQEA